MDNYGHSRLNLISGYASRPTVFRRLIRYRGGTQSEFMPSTFIRDKPLQALKLGSVIVAITFALAGGVGLLPGRGLDALLYLAFFPMVLSLVVAGETLLAGYRLARTDDPAARLTARRGYTAIRVIEGVVTVGSPGAFYLLIVRIGGEVAGPGAIGLLFIGIALGLLAFGAVLLRTLAEYYYHRRDHSSTRRVDHRRDLID